MKPMNAADDWRPIMERMISTVQPDEQRPAADRVRSWVATTYRRYSILAESMVQEPRLYSIRLPDRIGNGQRDEVVLDGRQDHAWLARLWTEYKWAQWLEAGRPFAVPSTAAGEPFSKSPPEQLLREYNGIMRRE